MRLQGLILLVSGLPFVPGLEGDEKGRIVAGTNITQQAEADEGSDSCDSRRIQQNFFHIGGDGRGASEGGAVGQLQIDQSVALIFVGKEARRDTAGKKETSTAKDRQHDDDDNGLLDQYRAPTHIAFCGALEYAIKPVKKSAQEPVALFSRLEQQGRQRRAEGECIE